MAKQGFTDPKLHDCGGDLTKEWYVSFRYTDPVTGKRKPFPHRRGLNYIDKKAERYIEGKTLASLLKDALQEGWNPFHEDYETYSLKQVEPSVPVGEVNALTFNEAMDFAFEEKKTHLADKSIETYKTVRDFAKDAAIAIRMDKTTISSIKRSHIKALLKQMQKDRERFYSEDYSRKVEEWSEWLSIRRSRDRSQPALKKFTGNTYNKYKRFLHGLFAVLLEYDALEYNPCSKIADKPEIKTRIHRHATAAEEKLIKKTLRHENINLYVFLAIEELAGLRPKEIFGIKIIDIDWFNQCFDIHGSEGRSKTRETRKVQIPNTLVPLLKMLKLEDHNPEHYIFSTGMLPGANRLKRSDTATKLYNKIVKKQLGLNVSQYSFKGLGGDKKRDVGISKNDVSKQFGHSRMTTTDIYLEREDERMRREIRDFTPGFD